MDYLLFLSFLKIIEGPFTLSMLFINRPRYVIRIAFNGYALLADPLIDLKRVSILPARHSADDFIGEGIACCSRRHIIYVRFHSNY